ncbi:polysaccharide biosynthesis C-terminal domain-containing protein, partial [Candidatus Pacearchaeota archaeon]|nr:polysaccharide biosynthesis C-terminal domain-containing protein [Candidatus Pacearchaeota archaeon]
KNYILRTTKITLMGTSILVLLLFVTAEFVIDLLYGANESLGPSLKEITRIYRCYAFVTIPHLVGLIFVRYHMVTKNTHFIFSTSLIAFVANIALNYLLMNWIGISGIALSTSLVMTIQCIFLMVFFLKKHSACPKRL